MTKAEIARQLGISRAYVTMLTKGERQPSKRLQKRIQKLTGKSSLSDSFDCFTRKRSLVQVQYRPPLIETEPQIARYHCRIVNRFLSWATASGVPEDVCLAAKHVPTPSSTI